MGKSLGQIAYEAYREAVGNVDYRGQPLLDWDQLSSDKIRSGWESAANAVKLKTLDDVNRIVDAL